MNIRTYTAPKMPLALAQVKRELGPHAVILHTRTVKRGGVLGLGGRTVVEVTATNSPSVRAARPAPARRPATAPGAGGSSPSGLAGPLIQQTYAAARAEFERHASPRDHRRPEKDGTVTQVAEPPRREWVCVPGERSVDAESDQGEPRPSVERDQLAEEMSEVKQMVARMMQDQRRGRISDSDPEMPQQLFDQYLRLLEQEVSEELADQIIRDVNEQLDASQSLDEKVVRQAVQAHVAGLIETDHDQETLMAMEDGRPKTIALIGPTGVGKTTTVAKLAANFKLRQKKTVGLITIDTYRIAAVDQLRTYANIIGVPLQVVLSQQDLTSAIRKYAGCDVVLIDTAGRSQHDDPKLEGLSQFIASADPHEVHLVLSSTCAQTVLLDTVERFSKIRTDRIIFTKLDEAVKFGVLLNVSRKVNKRLSFVTTGQDVPHHIEPSRSQRIAALVLGDTGT